MNANVIAASVAFMTNGETPRETIGMIIFLSNLIFLGLSLIMDFLPERNVTTNKADAAWLMTVAIAAPDAPMPNTNMNIGSNMMFSAAPITTVIILIVVFPCAEMKGLRPSVRSTKGVPIR